MSCSVNVAESELGDPFELAHPQVDLESPRQSAGGELCN